MALALLCLMFDGCGGRPPPPPPAKVSLPLPQPDELRRMVERYWDENDALMPWFSWYGAAAPFAATPGGGIAPQVLADSLALERRYLADVSAIVPARLDPASQLNREVFRRQRALAVEGFTYPFELLPLNPYDGMIQQYAEAAPAALRLGLSNEQEYAAWRSRTEDFARWSRQAITNMRDGMRRGYTLPRPLVQKTLPQLAALGADTDANVFYQALQSVSGASGADPTHSAEKLRADIRDLVLPSYRALHDFLEHDYLPRSRTTVALSALPLGEAWYAYLAKRTTGGALAPAELHALGVAEVERLRQRLQALLAEAGFPGDAPGFMEHLRHDPRWSYNSSSGLLEAYQNIKVNVAAAAAALFPAMPSIDFAFRAVENFRQPVAPPLAYRARSPGGTVGAVVYVDTADLESHPVIDASTAYLREAVPGHHLQQELQHERDDLPRFRRFAVEPAFMQGWALYAATLGEDLGLGNGPEMRFGMLRAELRCAVGLVIDTGLHAQGWTRTRAIEYVHASLPGDGPGDVELVDRVLSLPGEALACTVGYLKVQALRAQAQQQLGGRFELRAFHEAVLSEGAVPLDLLEIRIKAWMHAAAAAVADPAPEPRPPAATRPPPEVR